MRLITWNCQGAFARKHHAIEALHPDVLIVPECEPLKELSQTFDAKPLRSMHWVGDLKHKGLGVFTFGDYTLTDVPQATLPHRWILPVRIAGPFPITLMAVWTVPHSESRSYVQPLLEALSDYDSLHAETNVIWVGDFNASLRFDKPSTRHKFGDFLAAAAAKELHSLYHLATGESSGSESASTFFMHRNPDKGYHIDYILAGHSVRESTRSVVIGETSTWLKLSDHLPLILDIEEPVPT